MRRGLAAWCVCSLALVAGCTPSAPQPTVTRVPSPSTPTASTPTALVTSLADTAPPVALLASVPGLASVSRESMTAPVWVAQYPQLQGADRFNRTVAADIDATLAGYRAAPPRTPDAELNVSATLATADASRVGVMISAHRLDGDVPVSTYRTYVHDSGTGLDRTTVEYVAAGERREFARRVADALSRHGVPLLPAATDPSLEAAERLLDGLGLDDKGDVVVAVDSGLLTAPAEGAYRVVLPRGQVARYLNTEGGSWLAGVPSKDATTAPGRPPVTLPPASAGPTPVAPPDTGTDCAEVRCVALTFDDGPGSRTSQVLGALKTAGVRATFFVRGTSAQLHPELVRQMVTDGHAVGNHSWDHQLYPRLTPGEAADESTRTSDLLAILTGARPTMLRPPYGRFEPSTPSEGMAFVLWSVDSEDWKGTTAAQISARVRAQVKDGAIVRLREEAATIEALPGLLRQLQADGYTLVTVPDLLGGQLESGKAYYARR